MRSIHTLVAALRALAGVRDASAGLIAEVAPIEQTEESSLSRESLSAESSISNASLSNSTGSSSTRSIASLISTPSSSSTTVTASSVSVTQPHWTIIDDDDDEFFDIVFTDPVELTRTAVTYTRSTARPTPTPFYEDDDDFGLETISGDDTWWLEEGEEDKGDVVLIRETDRAKFEENHPSLNVAPRPDQLGPPPNIIQARPPPPIPSMPDDNSPVTQQKPDANPPVNQPKKDIQLAPPPENAPPAPRKPKLRPLVIPEVEPEVDISDMGSDDILDVKKPTKKPKRKELPKADHIDPGNAEVNDTPVIEQAEKPEQDSGIDFHDDYPDDMVIHHETSDEDEFYLPVNSAELHTPIIAVFLAIFSFVI